MAVEKITGIRLTLKTVKALLKQEFGIYGSVPTVEYSSAGVYIYKLRMGRLVLTVENDWLEHNGLYTVSISAGTGTHIRLYYDPNTLTENYEAEERKHEDHGVSCPLTEDDTKEVIT